jgi:FemAB-related protein (PEP-CTERM system-associated)
MTIQVDELTTELGDWDAFVRASDQGSPFHLTAWKQAVQETFGHRSHYLIARRDGAIDGVLPLFAVRTLSGARALISVPYGVYGGLCAGSPAASRALLDAATDLGRRQKVAYIELRQRQDLGFGLPTKADYVTFCRPISTSDADNARAIPRKQRRMTRLGASAGLQPVLGHDHLDAVYDLYAENVRALGSPVFPRRLFHALVAAFDKECQVLSVWREDRLMAGVLTLFYQDQVLPYYGAAVRHGARYAASDFMYWELMRHAGRAGFRVFDFGRSRVGSGSYDFKRHWGFEPSPLPYQYVLFGGRAMPRLSPSNPRFQLAARIWRRLPLAVTKRLGPVLTRHIPG